MESFLQGPWDLSKLFGEEKDQFLSFSSLDISGSQDIGQRGETRKIDQGKKFYCR